MTAVLGWYFAVQLLGTLAFLLTARACRALPDGGYTASKCLGVLLYGFLLWAATSLGILRNDLGGGILLIGIMTVLGVSAARAIVRLNPSSRPAPPRHVVVATEVLFLLAFGGWCLVRSADPAVNHTEQPMDLMLLTATASSPTFPPPDPWLAGYPISYYYLGYWIMSSVGHLTGAAPSISYNVGQASWYGLLVTTVFGITYNLAAADPRVRRAAALAAGVLGVTAVSLTSTLTFPVQWTAARMAGGAHALFNEPWWWFRSSRAVQDFDLAGRPIEIITEFPFFSYLLGDNHPHLLAMPFVALTVSLALALFLSSRDAAAAEDHASEDAETSRSRRILCGLLVITCAALVGINTWDLPAAFLLFLLALALPASSRLSRIQVLRHMAPALAAASLLIVAINVPYLLTAQSQLQGLLPNLFHPTALPQLVTTFGALMPGIVLLLWVAWCSAPPSGAQVARYFLAGIIACAGGFTAAAYWALHSTRGIEWMAGLAAGVEYPLARALERWMTGWPVLAILVLVISLGAALLQAQLRSQPKGPSSLAFPLLLICIGAGLILVPEVLYLHDAFGNRMNSVFKFYYQAWLLLGVGSAVGVTFAWLRGGAGRPAAAVALFGVGVGLMYAPVAVWSKTQMTPESPSTLDALAELRHRRPDEFAAIEWVRSNTRPGAVVVQAPGSSYDIDSSLISMATARPTLLGWEGHERQWRGEAYGAMAAGRREALAAIYTPGSAEALREVLSAWNVSFVYLGPRERAAFAVSSEHEARLRSTMELAFEGGGARIFRRRGE